jgi:hypothetical protein
MLILIAAVVVAAVALLRGGSLSHFVDLPLRWVPLVVAALALQLLIFTPFLKVPIIPVLTAPLYVVSMILLIGWVAANWRIPGMAIMAVGLLLNVVAIVANGGHMPVAIGQATYAGMIDRYTSGELAVHNNSIATAGPVRLWLLTDILALPAGVPLANVYSIGDVLLAIGASVLCWRTIRPGRRAAAAEDKKIVS